MKKRPNRPPEIIEAEKKEKEEAKGRADSFYENEQIVSSDTEEYPGAWLSLPLISKEAGRSVNSLRILFNRLETPHKPAPKGKGEVYRLKDALEAIYLVDQEGQVDPDKLDPYNRKLFYQAELEMMAVNEKRRHLIPLEEHENEVARIIKLILHELEPLPDLLERDTNMSPMQLSIVDAKISGLREAIYERLMQVPTTNDEENSEDTE